VEFRLPIIEIRLNYWSYYVELLMVRLYLNAYKEKTSKLVYFCSAWR